MMLKTFKGGVHAHDFKHLAKDSPIENAPAPQTVIVPMSQHIGKPAELTVKIGDAVKRGQLIGKASGFVSANVHSPVSGVVKAITDCNTPTGIVSKAAQIESDGLDVWCEGCNVEQNPFNLDAKQIVERITQCGVVGMGGATFPTHVKLSPPAEKKIDAVILNGVECEPYLTADYRLMLESPKTIINGLKLVMKSVGCEQGYIGIEANKPDAYDVMRNAAREMESDGRRVKVVMLKVKYPQGAEKQLINAILGRDVPSGGLPMDVGVVVQNVATAHAVYEACACNRPLIERIVTVTGEGVKTPKNFRARVGTPASALLSLCGYSEEKTSKLIFGGPMMGLSHFDVDMPVNKGMSGILALTDGNIFEYRHCIRCGRCVDACPMGLLPSELSIHGEAGRFKEARESCNLLDCIECGACTYVCPARRPIVQWIKLSKYEIARARAREAAKKAAEGKK